MPTAIQRAFIEHPASVGETYPQHCAHAFSFGWRMVGGGLACLVHGIFPSLFICTGSQTILALHDRMVVNRKSRSQCNAASGRTTTN